MKCKLNFSIKSLMILMVLSLGLSSFSNSLSLNDELNNAKNSKKTVFLIVTEKGIAVNKVLNVSKEATKIEKNSVILTMYRDDITNGELVNKFRLAGAPLPLILVIASNGIVAGGFKEADATSDLLIKAIPGPKQADVLQALSEKKAVFIVVYKKSFADKAKIVETCKSTIPQLKFNASIVEINFDDQKEKSFLTRIGVKDLSSSTIVAVANSQGQITGSFPGGADTKTLVAAATKVNKGCDPKSGCCGGAKKK
jgi:hypothetical protein